MILENNSAEHFARSAPRRLRLMRSTWIAVSIGVVAVGAASCYIVATKGAEHLLTLLPAREVACNADAEPYLVIGQSQASNSGNRRTFGDPEDQMLVEGKCRRLQDPVAGATGSGSSIWPTFGRAVRKNVMIANLAITGSTIGEWLKPSQMKRIRETLASLERTTGERATVIWMQGEADAIKPVDAAKHLLALNWLYSAAPGRHWMITRESKCYSMQTTSAGLNRARDAFAHRYANISIAIDLDALPMRLRQEDHCHFTGEGQRIIGEKLAAAIK